MKKTYIQPTALVILIHGNRMMMSGSNNLTGGGDASTSGVINQGDEGDVKCITDVNVWDNEW